jgi:diaminobutyrate-2-oxoglutarate transaminase
MHSAPQGNVAAAGLADDDADIFAVMESEVRSYCRYFPATFKSAKDAYLFAEDGTAYIDFFCGASSLNYGHNNDRIKQYLVSYLQDDGLMHALDMHTTAKRQFLTRLRDVILLPRALSYKVQFCGPTGADAVEAALKLARKVTGRTGVIAFSGAYHGMTMGALSATGSLEARRGSGIPLYGTTFLPYESGPWGSFDSIDLLSKILSDPSSGIEVPAAVIVEPVQMEGGIYPASSQWLRRLREITSEYGVLLIADEIQAGCGRTGTFFCFEQSGVRPDLVTLSKSISGYGLPMSIVLMRPDLDIWRPGEHAGTFRGNQLSFVAATAALEFWEDPAFLAHLENSARRLQECGVSLAKTDPSVQVRGRGMVLGIDLGEVGGPDRAAAAQRECFARGLILERCGRENEVLKLMPPLTVDSDVLQAGLDIVESAVLGTATALAGRRVQCL